MSLRNIFFLCALLFVSLFSCKKEQFNTDNSALLSFSTDTIQFDTVFTTIGSATQNFKVYNPYKKPIKISSIALADGRFFRLNINGQSAKHVENVEIDAEDSLFIFVEVNVDPNNQSNPLIVQDSIVFTTNGNKQDVKLVACGQDVNFINGEIIRHDTTWTANKPFLVYNSMLVDSGVTLTITAGTKIYFHHGSRLYVLGTLIASGDVYDPILFRNDRLEHWYDDVPGQWAGIYFATKRLNNNVVFGSKDNLLNYCEIKNAIIGIQADTNMNSDPTVTISNTKILNMNAVGIYGLGTNIKAWNDVIANCGQYALALTIGGSYEFYHCTIYNYWAYSNRQTASVLLNNYYQDINGNYQVRSLYKANFGNCIVYGNKDNEIEFDPFSTSSTFNFNFTNCLLKIDPTTSTTDLTRWINIFKNQSPGLKNPEIDDFSLDTLAYVKDKGDITIGGYFPIDIKNDSRISDGHPDIGAYERIE
jgi:hypothetical protein